MTDPKKRSETRRVPGPKSKRPVIPTSFQISRVSPMRQILDEAEGVAPVSPAEDAPVVQSEGLVTETSLITQTTHDAQEPQTEPSSLVRETSQVPQTRLVTETSLVRDQGEAWSETRLPTQTSLIEETSLVTETRPNDVDLFAGLPEVEGYLQIPNRIADHLLPLLSPYSQLVYFRLFRLSWGFGKSICTVSLPKLAEKTGVSQSSVQRAIADLEQKGLLRKAERVFGKSKSQGVTYEVVTGTRLVTETRPVSRTSLVRETNNKYLKENIKSSSDDESPIYRIRKIAARFREMNLGRSEYSMDRLRADVRTVLEGQGIEYDEGTLEAALKGITL